MFAPCVAVTLNIRVLHRIALHGMAWRRVASSTPSPSSPPNLPREGTLLFHSHHVPFLASCILSSSDARDGEVPCSPQRIAPAQPTPLFRLPFRYPPPPSHSPPLPNHASYLPASRPAYTPEAIHPGAISAVRRLWVVGSASRGLGALLRLTSQLPYLIQPVSQPASQPSDRLPCLFCRRRPTTDPR